MVLRNKEFPFPQVNSLGIPFKFPLLGATMALVILLISLFSLSSAHVFVSPLSLIKYKNIIVKKGKVMIVL